LISDFLTTKLWGEYLDIRSQQHVTEDGEYYITRSFMNCTLSKFIKMIKSRRRKLAGHAARTWAMRSAYKFLVGTSDGKRSLGEI